MSTLAIARKDFRDAIQSWLLIGVTALFVLVMGGTAFITALGPVIFPGDTTPPDFSGLSLAGSVSVFVPLIGLMVGYKSISGERETGTLDLLLSFPYTRGEVVLGKLVGRTGIVSVAAFVGFFIAAGIVLVLGLSISFGEYILFVVFSFVLGLVFVSIGIALSAATRSSTRALVGAIVIFGLFFHFGPLTLWLLIPVAIILIINQFISMDVTLIRENLRLPEWLQYYAHLNPVSAYTDVIQVMLSVPESRNFIAPDVPNAFGFVVLAFWLIVPLLLGYYRFDSTDL
jgi:ABC-2 type transport system permease protein